MVDDPRMNGSRLLPLAAQSLLVFALAPGSWCLPVVCPLAGAQAEASRTCHANSGHATMDASTTGDDCAQGDGDQERPAQRNAMPVGLSSCCLAQAVASLSADSSGPALRLSGALALDEAVEPSDGAARPPLAASALTDAVSAASSRPPLFTLYSALLI